MELLKEEADVFWPLYNKYNKYNNKVSVIPNIWFYLMAMAIAHLI